MLRGEMEMRNREKRCKREKCSQMKCESPTLLFTFSFPFLHRMLMRWGECVGGGRGMCFQWQTSWRVHTKLTEVRDHPHKLLLYFLFLVVYVFVRTYFEFKLYWECVSRRCVGETWSTVWCSERLLECAFLCICGINKIQVIKIKWTKLWNESVDTNNSNSTGL